MKQRSRFQNLLYLIFVFFALSINARKYQDQDLVYTVDGQPVILYDLRTFPRSSDNATDDPAGISLQEFDEVLHNSDRKLVYVPAPVRRCFNRMGILSQDHTDYDAAPSSLFIFSL